MHASVSSCMRNCVRVCAGVYTYVRTFVHVCVFNSRVSELHNVCVCYRGRAGAELGMMKHGVAQQCACACGRARVRSRMYLCMTLWEGVCVLMCYVACMRACGCCYYSNTNLSMLMCVRVCMRACVSDMCDRVFACVCACVMRAHVRAQACLAACSSNKLFVKLNSKLQNWSL